MAVDFVTNFIATGSEKLIKTIKTVSQQSASVAANTAKALQQQAKSFLLTANAAKGLTNVVGVVTKGYSNLASTAKTTAKSMLLMTEIASSRAMLGMSSAANIASVAYKGLADNAVKSFQAIDNALESVVFNPSVVQGTQNLAALFKGLSDNAVRSFQSIDKALENIVFNPSGITKGIQGVGPKVLLFVDDIIQKSIQKVSGSNIFQNLFTFSSGSLSKALGQIPNFIKGFDALSASAINSSKAFGATVVAVAKTTKTGSQLLGIFKGFTPVIKDVTRLGAAWGIANAGISDQLKSVGLLTKKSRLLVDTFSMFRFGAMNPLVGTNPITGGIGATLNYFSMAEASAKRGIRLSTEQFRATIILLRNWRLITQTITASYAAIRANVAGYELIDLNMARIKDKLGATETQLNNFRNTLDDIGKKFGALRAGLAPLAERFVLEEGLGLESAGVALEAYSAIAIKSGMLLEETYDVITQAADVLGDKDFAITADKIARAAQGNTSIKDLATSIQLVGRAAEGSAAMTSDAMLVFTALLQRTGLDAQQSGGELVAVLQRINGQVQQIASQDDPSLLGIDPSVDVKNIDTVTNKSSDAVVRIANLFRTAQGDVRALEDTLPDLREALGKYSESEQGIILTSLFGRSGIATVRTLLELTEEEVRAMLMNVSGASGNIQMGRAVEDSYGLALARFQAAVEATSVKIAEAIKPVETALMNMSTSFLRIFDGLPAPVEKLLLVLGGFTPVLTLIGSLLSPLTAIWVTWKVAIPLLFRYVDGLDRGVRSYINLGKAQTRFNDSLNKSKTLLKSIDERLGQRRDERTENLRKINAELEGQKVDRGYVDTARANGGVDRGAARRILDSKLRVQELQEEQVKLNQAIAKGEALREKTVAVIDKEAEALERIAEAASGGEDSVLALQQLPEEQAKLEEVQRKAKVENLRLDTERLKIANAQYRTGIEIEKTEAKLAKYRASLGVSQGAPLLIKEAEAELQALRETELKLGEDIIANDVARERVTQTVRTQSDVVRGLTEISKKSTTDLGNFQDKIAKGVGSSLGQVENAGEAYVAVSDKVRGVFDQLLGVTEEIGKATLIDDLGISKATVTAENKTISTLKNIQAGFNSTFGGLTATIGKTTSKIWGGFTTAATKATRSTAHVIAKTLLPSPIYKAVGGVVNTAVNGVAMAANAVRGIAGTIVNKIAPTVTAVVADMLPMLALGVVIGAAADAFQRLTQQTAQAKKDVREMKKDFSEFLRLKQLEEGAVDTTVAFKLEAEGIKSIKEDLNFALKPFDAIGDAAERVQAELESVGDSADGAGKKLAASVPSNAILLNFFATWNDVTEGQLRDIRKAFNMIADEGIMSAQEISKAFDDGKIDIDTESGQQALLTLQNALSKLSAANTQGQTDLEGTKRVAVGAIASVISKLQEGADGAVEAGEAITLFTTAVTALDVAGGQLDLDLLEEQKQAYIDFAGDAQGLQSRLEEIETSGADRRLALLKENLIKVQASQADDGEEKQSKINDIQQQILQLEIQGYQKRLGEQEDFQEESKASLIDSLQEQRDIELDEIQDAGQLRKLAILSDDSLTADQRSAALLNMEKNLNAETLVQKQLALAELVDKGVQATKEEETKRLALIEKYEDEMVGIRIQMTEAYITATEKATEEQQRLAEEAAEEQQRIAEEAAEELERIEQERIELEDANREASTQKELRDIDLISAKYQAATDAKVAGFDAVLEAIDDQNDALTQQGKLLDLQIEKLQIQADRTAAGDDARIAGLENAGELIARLNSGEAGIVEKRLIQQQLTKLGLSDKTTELELLDAQQKAESNRRRNENILLQKRQELEVVQLQNQQAQEQLALKRAVTEAQINKTKAQQLVIDQQILQLQNQVALVRAQSALDVAKSRGASPAELVALQTEVDAQTQINKLGQQGLDAAQAGVTLADEQVADAKDAVAEYQKIAELQTQNLKLSQSFALSQKQAADETERLAAALERAALAGDKVKANAIVGTPEVEPKRHGGTVTPGSLYQVNEAGMEAFKPLGGKPQLLNQPANSLFSPLVPGRILTAPQVNQMLPSFSNGSSGGLVGLGRLESEIRGLRSDIASRPVQVDMGASTFINEPSPLATQLQIARGRLKAARGLL